MEGLVILQLAAQVFHPEPGQDRDEAPLLTFALGCGLISRVSAEEFGNYTCQVDGGAVTITDFAESVEGNISDSI